MRGGFAPPEGEFVLPEGGFALSRSGRALLGWARGSSIGLTTSDKWESVVTEKRKRHAEQQVQEEQRAEYEKRVIPLFCCYFWARRHTILH